MLLMRIHKNVRTRSAVKFPIGLLQTVLLTSVLTRTNENLLPSFIIEAHAHHT